MTTKTPEVSKMIRDLVQMVERELGAKLPTDSVHRVEAALCQQYGGERLYVPKLPKLVHQVRLADIGSGMHGAAVAAEMRLSVRQVRRIVRGR